jgi:outer membrane protein OmpA-like peptidoglycan-associated protein
VRVVERGGSAAAPVGREPRLALTVPPTPAALRRNGAAGLLALQRTAGNKAVGAHLATRGQPPRAPGERATPPGRKPDQRERATPPGRAPDQRATPPGRAAAGRRLARVPVYNPRPAWAWMCSNQGAYAHGMPWWVPDWMDRPCEPLALHEAPVAKWLYWSREFTDRAVERIDCPADARRVWEAYFSATGTPRFVWSETRDPASCVVRSLKGDDPSHAAPEQAIFDRVAANIGTLLPRLRGVASVRVPLADAGVTPDLLAPPLTFNNNTRVGGQFFGGVAGPRDRPVSGPNCGSEYGPDTRAVDGHVELTKQVDPADPRTIRVQTHFVLHWHVTDAVDFCPGNTGERAPAYQVRVGVVIASRLEASGMARDVYVEADYTRERDGALLGPFPNPDPAPPQVITVPAEALFGFDQDRLTEAAEVALRTALGDRPTRADPNQPVRVRGHTDSIPGPTPDYNQRLSERRAAAVRRFLEHEYPNLRGHVEESGAGDTQPIAPNDDAAGRARNRRVEIELHEVVTPGP